MFEAQMAYERIKAAGGEDLQRLLEHCAAAGAKAYFTGGCVRDALLARKVADVDIELHEISPEQLERLAAKLGATGVGKAFFVYKWRGFDIALARTERCTGARHQDFAVAPARSLSEAVQRRDFTINALMIDAANGELIDLCGGLVDLRARVLRPVNFATFCEDALRVLRGVQFASRLGFRLENLEYLRSINLNALSASRIESELVKFLAAARPEIGLWYLHALGHTRLLNVSANAQVIARACDGLKRLRRSVLSSADGANLLGAKAVFFALLHAGAQPLEAAPSAHAKALAAAAKMPMSAANEREVALLATEKPFKEYLLAHIEPQSAAIARKLGVYERKIFCDMRGCKSAADAAARREAAVRKFLRSLDV